MKLIEILQKVAERENIFEASFDIPMKCEDGQGFLGDIGFVSIKGKRKNGEQVDLKLIIKTAATNEILREKTIVPKIFQREIFMYKTVLPTFNSFQLQRFISKPFNNVAKFYGASMLTNPEILVLENLTENGYTIWNRWQQMNDSHVRMVLREYGRFHAISFAMQDQEPEVFRTLTQNFDNVLEGFLHKSGFLNTFINKAIQAQASLDPHIDQYVMKRYSAFLHGIEDTFQELIESHNSYNVILHGDCWSNNMMFQYKNPGNFENPDSIRLIDFQFSRLGAPVCDFVYFFYPCASKEILGNLNIYKTVYYDSFSSHLKELGTDPEKVYSLAAFEEDFRKYVRFGLIISSLARYAMLSKDDEVVNFSNIIQSGMLLNTAFDYKIAKLSTYNERMRDVIIHCVENNFL